MSKLILHVPEELVSAAESEAASRHVSVSKLVADFFSALASKHSEASIEGDSLAPRTKNLLGCIPENDTDLENYIDHLDHKKTVR